MVRRKADVITSALQDGLQLYWAAGTTDPRGRGVLAIKQKQISRRVLLTVYFCTFLKKNFLKHSFNLQCATVACKKNTPTG